MEKIYKTMKSSGVWNIVLGIVCIVISIFIGVTAIVNGGRLLASKKDLTF